MRSPFRDSDQSISYVIDANDVIEAVCGPWDAFATANGAPALTVESVTGRPFHDFITDASTSHIYRRLVSRVRREDRIVPLDLRCDGPAARRWLRLTVHPMPSGRVLFESRIVREEVRDRVMLLDPNTVRAGDPLRICSWCDCMHTPDGWRELEVGVPALKLFDAGPLPPITHAICPRCESAYDIAG